MHAWWCCNRMHITHDVTWTRAIETRATSQLRRAPHKVDCLRRKEDHGKKTSQVDTLTCERYYLVHSSSHALSPESLKMLASLLTKRDCVLAPPRHYDLLQELRCRVGNRTWADCDDKGHTRLCRLEMHGLMWTTSRRL